MAVMRLPRRCLAHVFPGWHLSTIGVGCAIPPVDTAGTQKWRLKPADGAAAAQL
jgi:hypothetical protein